MGTRADSGMRAPSVLSRTFTLHREGLGTGVHLKKVRTFAETLFSQGGPAVDQATRIFGTETARRLIVGAMYGVKGV